MNRRKVWTACLVLSLLVLALFLSFRYERAKAPNDKQKSRQGSTPQSQTTPQVTVGGPNLEDPAGLAIIVNKKRALPSDYAPSDLKSPSIGGGQLRAEATERLNLLVGAARNDGLSLKMISGYRSYESQRVLYNSYVASDGQAKADTYSARPGHSEHQTGWAADLGNPDGNCDLQICFAQTEAGKWLATNAHKHGFIIRYLDGKDAVTGYQYEPWHVRYVGVELAMQIHLSGKTMEDYFNLPAAPSY